MKALVGPFNQEKALVGAFSVITNLRMQFVCNFLKHYWLPRRGAGGEVAGEGEEEDCAGDHGDEDGEEEHRQPQRGHAQQPRARALGVGCIIVCVFSCLCFNIQSAK